MITSAFVDLAIVSSKDCFVVVGYVHNVTRWFLDVKSIGKLFLFFLVGLRYLVTVEICIRCWNTEKSGRAEKLGKSPVHPSLSNILVPPKHRDYPLLISLYKIQVAFY